ncbi:flagellar hook-length control protein FliK [Massilia sp. KIM]|uniref:flagellar hook-length control protein FliK n=1 Tax=Massilia sp. KIM TaxID=1955422 RepID=UPI00098ECBE2|nr:flagellar hook-length control protein FliK [Massilia sp. KIM]OON61058.1 flagellar hook-length control protein FliK [Massilia sp. KIM]
MLPRELVSAVTRIDPAQPAERLADPRQQAFQRAVAPLLGKAIHGEVLAKLTDGSFVVKVADVPARMQLPPGAQVGADVPMTLVALQPRATFQVGAQGPGGRAGFSEAGPPLPEGADPAKAPLAYREGAPVGRAAALLAQAGAAGALPLGADTNSATLSPTGKAIAGVLAAAARAETQQSAVVARTPALPAAGLEPAAIAQGLQQAVGKSGLFYESHVAEWARGARALSELATEPQQQAAREGAKPVALEPATAQFINLQLATQEQARLVWQGPIWPGQQMEWEVEREADGRQAGDDGDGGVWHSRLRLRFPELGELEADLSLTEGGLQVRFAAGSEDSASLLRRHAPELRAALEAAGTRLTAFDARSAGPATGERDE